MAMRVHHQRPVRRLTLFPLLFAAFLIAGLPTADAHAQTVNWAPSVTSMGFGGSSHLGGVPPSVTSLGFGRIHPSPAGGHGGSSNPPSPRIPNEHSRHHRPLSPAWGGYYAYPIYDYGDAYRDDSGAAEEESQDQYLGGPTIFDRRGNGQYQPPGTTQHSDQAQETLSASSAPPSEPVPVVNQPQTVLIFKDGHHTAVANYAIVGSTLYDFTDGMRHKIALADLDLKATAQQNDDRGVDFEIPSVSQQN